MTDGGPLRIQPGNTPLERACNRGARYPFPLGLGACHAGFDAFTHQGTFKLGQRGHHREDQLPLRRGGVDVLLIGNKYLTKNFFDIMPKLYLINHEWLFVADAI
jgi:hypothetical protein